MSTTLTEPRTATFTTLADLLAHLGDVPPERVRFDPLPGTATEADLIALNDQKQGIDELVDGFLVQKAPGFLQSCLAGALASLLHTWLDEHPLGLLTNARGQMRLPNDRVRGPDVCFTGWEQFPFHEIPDEPIPNLHPELAVEFVSDGETPGELRLRREDYFGSGTALVWEIDPRKDVETVTVYTDVDESTVYGKDETIDGGDVLPGFRFTLQELFDRAVHRR